VLGAYFILYPGSRVTTWIFPVFVVRIPAWIWLGLWFLYQLIEGSFGLFNAKANGGGVAFFAHVGGFVFGVLVTRLLVRAGQATPPGEIRRQLAALTGGMYQEANHRLTAPAGGRRDATRRAASGAGTPSSRRQASGELVHGCLVHVFRMPLAQPQQPEQAAGHRAERDLRVGDGETPGSLPGPDVTQGAWHQPAGRVQGLQADAGQEPGDIGMRPAQSPGDPQRDGEHLRRVADVRTGWSITCPSCSSSSPDAVPNSCSLLPKWL
jgi:hypothetical protein